ncbi:MAG TPA: peptidoglycan-binding domain-containing protein [Pseudonocardia sp.]|nr:peptidoglycan-binding domain-containing protein [Pseudonocardia sp.]
MPLLRLQALAGNRAVAGLLAPLARADGRPAVAQREAAGAPATARRTSLSSPRFVGDPTLEACLQDRARLGEGASGLSVGRVQQALVDLGHDLGAGADQRYGPKTAAAVRSFKTDQALGFTQFGDVGPGTMGRLDELFPGPLPPCKPDDIPVTAGQAKAVTAAPGAETTGAGVGIPGLRCQIGPVPGPKAAIAPVRAPSTPGPMPDRIPPKIDVPVAVTLPGGAATPTTVKAVPTQAGGAEPGEVLIDGKPSADLTASGTVTVKGTAQTFSRFVNQLSLVAVQGGKEIARSAPFAVAALPVGLDTTKNSDSGRGSLLRGMIVDFTVRSDSGDRADLDKVQAKEVLENRQNTGCFSTFDAQAVLDRNAPGFGLGIDQQRTDKHRIESSVLTSPGVWQIGQVLLFRDLRTGAGDIPIPHSAYEIAWNVNKFSVGDGLFFVLTKIGVDGSAKGFASSFGFGNAFSVQEV